MKVKKKATTRSEVAAAIDLTHPGFTEDAWVKRMVAEDKARNGRKSKRGPKQIRKTR